LVETLIGTLLLPLNNGSARGGAEDSHDAIGVIFDVVVEFDGQQSGLKGIRGVETVLESAVLGGPISDGVRPAIGHGHDARDITNMAHDR
jgi:hypothetical protein